jgi:hypothetical protein
MFSRGIAKVAIESHSVVITAGVEMGAVGYIGRGNRDWNHKVGPETVQEGVKCGPRGGQTRSDTSGVAIWTGTTR